MEIGFQSPKTIAQASATLLDCMWLSITIQDLAISTDLNVFDALDHVDTVITRAAKRVHAFDSGVNLAAWCLMVDDNDITTLTARDYLFIN